MITKLTPYQEFQLDVYRDKWINIGLSTDRIDRPSAIQTIHDLQTIVLNRPKTPVIFLDNPVQAWLAVVMFSSNTSQVQSQVWDQVQSQVRNQVQSQVWYQVQSQVRNQVQSQVQDQVWDQVRDQVRAKFESMAGNIIYPYIQGSFASYIFSYYDYYQNELSIKSSFWNKFNVWKKTSELGYVYPLDDVCIVSEKPTKIKIVNGRLHCDGGPSIEYAGDFKVWSLNGVRVPQYLAETPEGQLDVDFFKKEKNADIRTEFIRKYGIERMESFGREIDSHLKYSNEIFQKSEYKLIDMSSIFQSIDYAPYLKMRNLTTGVYHLEGVHPDCETIEDALSYRTKNKQIKLEGIK